MGTLTCLVFLVRQLFGVGVLGDRSTFYISVRSDMSCGHAWIIWISMDLTQITGLDLLWICAWICGSDGYKGYGFPDLTALRGMDFCWISYGFFLDLTDLVWI